MAVSGSQPDNVGVEVFSQAHRALPWGEPYIYLFLFGVLLVEEAGVPLPVPGDLLLAITGYQVSLGHVSAVFAVLSLLAGACAGSLILFTISGLFGPPLLERLLRFLRIDTRYPDHMRRWLFGHPLRTLGVIIAGRLLPGCRAPTSVLCGTLGVPRWRFMVGTALGASLWIGVLLALGAVLGRSLVKLYSILHLPLSTSLTLAAVVAGLFLAVALWRFLRHRPA